MFISSWLDHVEAFEAAVFNEVFSGDQQYQYEVLNVTRHQLLMMETF
jgi:hypothetical protein